MPLAIDIPPSVAVKSAAVFQYAIGVGQPVGEDHVIILDSCELLLTAATTIPDAVWRVGDDEVDAAVGETLEADVDVDVVDLID
ncbi:hypothetical protein EDD73_12930 [Heliophilum fasciatum]|uniref:Uncharacterized protein n=1 Tax=Heliophilum fasciatum TaxID=35700 RepID=A0A4R2RGQ2_9FIRM|nr:hypothetical protein [Heliophilum fasciatum]TCP61277.1 hypothetical protein EDD73_12930 [Heliophilum fasciatum]